MSDDDFYYPKLDETTLRNLDLVRKLSMEHAAYLLASPYSGEVEKLIRKWFLEPGQGTGTRSGSGAGKKPSAASTMDWGSGKADDEEDEVELDTGPEGESKWEMLYREAHALFLQMKRSGAGIQEISEKNAYYRTATALLEKLVSLQERALGLKEIHEFQQSVLGILESVCTQDQRNEVISKLAEANSK